MTQNKLKPETLGAWVVHHGRKLQSDQDGAAEFSAIDGAAKGSLLLAGMASSDKADLSAKEVTVLAQAASLNPKTELNGYRPRRPRSRVLGPSNRYERRCRRGQCPERGRPIDAQVGMGGQGADAPVGHRALGCRQRVSRPGHALGHPGSNVPGPGRRGVAEIP
jgi:hypothetical protein